MNRRRTYWHLEPLQRKPTEYEIATSQLLYYPTQGFEVATPGASWYQRYQQACPLRADDWERFSDPRQTTYAKYTALQADKENYLEGVVASHMERGCDTGLDAAWLDSLASVLGPLRYPVHGLQMIAAYVGQMAPCGRIAVAALFQTADEVRRIQHLAIRMRQLQRVRDDFGRNSKERWERAATWQPWRELIERLLVTYDWGEAFVALNLVAKPMFDALFMQFLGTLGRSKGDVLSAEVLRSLDRDCQWHRDWSLALARLISENEENVQPVKTWLERWYPLAVRALRVTAESLELGDAASKADESCRAGWHSAGFEVRLDRLRNPG